MIGRRAVVGLTLLCALLFSAFAASSAQASNGTTAFTCEKVTKGAQFSDAHCTKEGTGEGFIHKEIKQDETTTIHGTNEKTSADTKTATSAILTSSIGGEPAEITCEKVFAHGGLVNRLDPITKEHYIEGEAGITILYTGCKFLKPSTCKLKEEKIEVTGARATTKGQGDSIRFEPPEGSKVFVTLLAEKCFGIAKLPIEGTVNGKVNGATLEFTAAETTAEKTLTFNKQPAGLEGKITLSQAEKTEESAKTGNPISATTVT